MTKYLAYILNLIYPPRCEICTGELPTASRHRICLACFRKIILIGEYSCYRCGKPLQIATKFCADCRGNDGLSFDRIVAAGIYQGVLRDSIRIFKYGGRSCLGMELGQLLQDVYRRNFLDRPADFLIPVPLHKKQSRKRQYNQSAILADSLGKAFAVPVWPKALARTRATAPQYELDKNERAENVRGAFRWQGRGRVEGRRVLLIDDICTTGSTINECACVLKAQGAAEVYGLVLAHG